MERKRLNVEMRGGRTVEGVEGEGVCGRGRQKSSVGVECKGLKRCNKRKRRREEGES